MTISLNRLANTGNAYQGSAKRVLCVCSAGLLRSPTAANVLHINWGFNTRSAGISKEYALIPVDEALLTWADEVVVMSHEQGKYLLDEFPDYISEYVCLDIPDMFEWGSEKLVSMITKRYGETLKDD